MDLKRTEWEGAGYFHLVQDVDKGPALLNSE
jgi:hypothetical protein